MNNFTTVQELSMMPENIQEQHQVFLRRQVKAELTLTSVVLHVFTFSRLN